MIAYLSGPIENAHNDGADWRNDITHWLDRELDHQVFNPVEETKSLTKNLNTDDSSSPGSHTILSIPALNRIEVAVDTSGGNISNYIANSGKIFKAGTSTGPYLDGYYLQFTSAPDLDKPITVLHNFDK